MILRNHLARDTVARLIVFSSECLRTTLGAERDDASAGLWGRRGPNQTARGCSHFPSLWMADFTWAASRPCDIMSLKDDRLLLDGGYGFGTGSLSDAFAPND